MASNQKYSARIHSRRQLTRASDHIRSASLVLCEIKPRYEGALPNVAWACVEMINMLSMCENMIRDMRENI